MLNARKLYKDTDISDIRGILEVRVGKTPDVPIFRYKKGREVITVTYGQAWRDIWKLGAFLDKVCPEKGNVALLGENSYFWIITYFATILTGRVIIPLDRDLDTSTLEKLISRSEAQVLVYSSSFDEFVSGLSSSGKAGNVVSMDSFSDVLSGPDAPVPPYEPNPDSVCTILFTSGTTGEPKGVMLTQRNIARNVINAVQIVWFTGPSVLTLPLHHSFPFTINVLGAWICGSCAFISSGLRHFQNELKLYHPENLALVPLYVE
ncbi:MAG: acyl--CoA ligase, partial [Bacteroidales bacterium]|nr:acyl--CoA ligase [Bacteroidales bacterium]